jgi:hypothetical protein
VELEWLRLSGDSFAAFLDAATSITALKICNCRMEAPGGAIAVGAALQRNKSIRRLELNDLDDEYLLPILHSLASNTPVKELKVSFKKISLAESLAVKSLLESTKTIRQFELQARLVEADTEGNFHRIGQGLVQSTSVTDVKFGNCYFGTHEVVLLLNSILESKSNLQSLAFFSCFVYEGGQDLFHAAIISLLKSQSMLRSLELCPFNPQTPQQFTRLLSAVETSPLERFYPGWIRSREQFLLLIVSIPKMHVRTLLLSLHRDLRDMKVYLLWALYRNASLRTVVAYDWFDNDDRMKLDAYSTRNEFFTQWMENPTAVPRAAWSEYLSAVAQTSSPDAVFRILQALTNVPVSWFEVGRNAKSAAVMMHRPNLWSLLTQRGIKYLCACCCCRERIWESA